jgi:hypothetical protein
MATATATVTISRASHADAKTLVPLTATHDGNFRYPQPQDTTLQQHPTPTGFGQPGQTHNSVSDGSASAKHDSSSSSPPENTVAINPQSRPSQPAALAPTANLGPCSKQTQMPPRPKPGRKPLPQEDAQDRRRLQNRMAQRSFRDKRAQKVSELQQDNQRIREEADHAHKLLSNALQGQKELSAKLTVENERLKAELQAANKRADDAERRLQRTSHSDGVMRSLNFPHATLQNIGSSTSLPPMVANWTGPVADHARASSGVLATSGGDDNNNNNWAEYETDMTASWSNRKANNAAQSNNVAQNNDNDSQWLSSTMDVDREKDQCGFCTDEGNCACMQSQVTQPQPQPQVQPSPPAIMPGGCDACLRDPARAAACKSMADQAEFTSRPNQNSGAINQRNDSMAPTPAMITCSSAIDRLGPNMPSIGDLFPGTFHAYPRASGEGFDLAEQEVAQVLQSMRRNTATGSDLQN